MTNDVNTSLTALDAAISQLDTQLDRLRSIESVDLPEFDAALREASGHVEALRSYAAHLATRVGSDAPSWRDRQGYLTAVATLHSAVARGELREREILRRAAIAEVIENGRIEHPVPLLRKAYLELAELAAQALREAIEEIFDPLGGPDDPAIWVPWARSTSTNDRGKVPDRVAHFLDHVPDGAWLPAQASGEKSVTASSPSEAMPPIPMAPLVASPSTPAAPSPTTELASIAHALVTVTEVSASPEFELPPVEPAAPASEDPPVAVLAPAVERSEDASVPPRVSTVPSFDIVLEDKLRSFDAYRDAWWYSPSGKVERAPWRDASFAGSVAGAFAAAAAEREPPFHVLWLMAAASRAVGANDLPSPEDVVTLAGLWASPAHVGAAADPTRVRRLRDSLTEGKYSESPGTRLQLMFEALGPSHELMGDDAETFTVFAGFHDRWLREVIDGFLRLATQGDSPATRLRDALDPAHRADPNVAARSVEAAREAFRKEFLRVQHAGGGNIEHTHCREAWGDFIAAIEPRVRELTSPRDAASRPLDELAKTARGITQVHAKIADKHGARLKDRHKMDRMADRLRDFALTLVDALRAQVQVTSRRPAVNGCAELVESWRKLTASSPLVGDEELIRQLLLRVIDPTPKADERDTFGLTLAEFAARPDLVGCFSDIDISEHGRAPRGDAVVADVRRTTDPRHAAALWIRPAMAAGDGSLLDSLLRALDQPHLRAFAGPFLLRLSESEQRRVHASRSAEEQQLWRRHDRLRAVWRSLSDLVVGMAADVRRVVTDVENTLETDVTTALAPLYAAWIDAVSDRCDVAVRRAIEALVEAGAALEPAVAATVRTALDAGRYADAHRLLHETGADQAGETLRHTPFRSEAIARFGQPSVAIQSITTHKDLVVAWGRGVTGAMNHGDHTLRTAFKDTFFRSTDLQVQNNPKELRVSCEQVRDWLKRNRLNPSFVPQLARYRELIVLTPPTAPHQSSFVQAVGQQVAGYDGHLVAVLAPRITERTRADTAAELRRRGVAGIVDDLDLCRLLNPGGVEPNLVIALLEVLLEQQRWTSVTPFLLPDGQNVQMEMFVGRRDEARELAHTARYSRLFSGRKLGKSALLRFIEATEDGHRLPSGRTLRVLYVSAVGVDSERALVQRIGDALTARFDFRPNPHFDHVEQPRDRLMELVRWFRAARKEDSLLVVLDEADAFIEQQIEAYERERERCLSFFMRSTIEQDRDSQGLACVRFIFSGYRVTNTTEGTWANWGDVLRLTPLVPDDAADLVARPLARLGIDCGRQMRAIAHRCGHQPAVLLRFGECLLARVEQRFPIAARDRARVEVSDEDITITFEDDRIQDEIRTVVRNNFHGNPIGRVVFGAVLMAFLRLPPGQALTDAEYRVLDLLRDLSDGDLGWLGEGEASARGAIRMRLRDLVERQLLVERRGPGSVDPSFLIRFPHHLPTLTPLSQEAGIRDEIRSLQRAGAADRAAERCEVLSRADVQQIREFAGWTELRVLPVVASLWPSALLHAGVGLPDRLGIDRDRVLPASSRMDATTTLARKRRTLVHDASPARLIEVVDAWPAAVALPVFTGGADLLRWAARAGQPSGSPWGDAVCVEPFALGRWSLSTVSWWFTRVRGVNFPRPDAVEVVALRTSGIGFLVRLFDELLFGEVGLSEGQDVGQDVFDRTLNLYEERLAAHVRALRDGDDATRLDPREIEILQMVVSVHADGKVTDLRECLMELWGEFFQSTFAAPALEASDAPSLAVLQGLGLLPVRLDGPASLPLDRLAPLQTDDALFRVVEALRS
jgi:hypothetical protein